jgi:hypothetical protein
MASVAYRLVACLGLAAMKVEVDSSLADEMNRVLGRPKRVVRM